MQLYSCICFGLHKFVNSERHGGSVSHRLCRQRVTVSRSSQVQVTRVVFLPFWFVTYLWYGIWG